LSLHHLDLMQFLLPHFLDCWDKHLNFKALYPMKEIYTRNQVVVLREEFDDWAVLYNPDNAEAVGTNPIGVEIWKNLDGKRSVGDIIAGIKQEYNNVSENAETEISEFIQKLVQHGLIGIRSTL
jgi:SynChlorMet cassette protein ScmD